MNTLRCCLAVLGGAAFGLALTGFGPTPTGIGLAVAAGSYLAWCLVRAIQQDKERR